MKKFFIRFLILSIGAFFISSCENDDPKYGSPPTPAAPGIEVLLTTIPATSIEIHSATTGGIILSDNLNVLEVGACWSKDNNPTVKPDFFATGEYNGSGRFSVNISGIDGSSKYYFRSYIKTQHGLTYGNVLSFQTKEDPTIPEPGEPGQPEGPVEPDPTHVGDWYLIKQEIVSNTGNMGVDNLLNISENILSNADYLTLKEDGTFIATTGPDELGFEDGTSGNFYFFPNEVKIIIKEGALSHTVTGEYDGDVIRIPFDVTIVMQAVVELFFPNTPLPPGSVTAYFTYKK